MIMIWRSFFNSSVFFLFFFSLSVEYLWVLVFRRSSCKDSVF